MSEIARLRQLQEQWRELVAADAAATPFQLPSWLLLWWEHFGGGSLHVLVFNEGCRLLGILPCFRHRWEGRRQLTLIGSGISDYLDPPIHPGIVPALQQHLAENTDWDICVLQDLSSDTLLQKLRGAVLQPEMQCGEARLTGDFETFWDGRSKDLRRNLKRYSQRARALGPVEFDVADDAAPELLDTLIRLHSARWREQGEPGMIAVNRSEHFLRAAVAQMAREDVIRFFALRFRGDVAAVILAFRYRNRIYAYMSAFDPDYESLGFGRILLYEAFRHAYAEGYDAWNFLRGDEPYKVSWGAQPIERCRIVIHRA